MSKGPTQPPNQPHSLRVLRGKVAPPKQQAPTPVWAPSERIARWGPPLPLTHVRRSALPILTPHPSRLPPQEPSEPAPTDEAQAVPPVDVGTPRVVRQLNLLASLLRAGRRGLSPSEVLEVQGYDEFPLLLSPKSRSAKSLAAHERKVHETNMRRLARDCEVLQQDGVKTESFTGPDGVLRYRLSLGAVMARPLCLADDELILLEDVIARFRDAMSGQFGRHLLSAAVKLKAGTPNAAASDEQLSGVASGPSPRLADGARLLACLEGIAERRPVRISYQSVVSAKPSTRTIDPYRVIRRGSHLYLYGFEHESALRKTFRLSRMRGTPKVLHEKPTFEQPDLSDDPHIPDPVMLEGGNGTIRNLVVEFDHHVAFMVVNELGGQHVMRTTPSGGVRLALRRAFPGELFAYLADYAGHFRVVGPQEAVLDIRARLEETLTLYGA